MKVPFVEESFDVGEHVETVEDVVIPATPSEDGSDSQTSQNNGGGEIIPETSSESDGAQSEDIFSDDLETMPNENDFVETSSEDEPIVESEHFENVIVPESDDGGNSNEHGISNSPHVPSNEVIHDAPENENSSENVVVSETSSESESDAASHSFQNSIVMETDLRESDADSNSESHDVPLQIDPVCTPETDPSEFDEAERSEFHSPTENEVTIPETSSESEEDNYEAAVEDHLLTPTSIHAPPNQNTEPSPDIFSDISAHSSYREVVFNDAVGSQNSFVTAEQLMTRSPSLFSDDNVSEAFSIVPETQSVQISPDLFEDDAFESSEILDNRQNTEEMSIVNEDSEEIAGTPLAHVLAVPFVAPAAASEPVILPQSLNESVPIVPPVFEYQSPVEFADEDETLLLQLNNPIEISAASRAIIERIERFIAGVVGDIRNGSKIQILVQNRSNWDNCFIENERFVLLPIADARCRHIKSTFCLSVIFYVLGEIHEMLLTNRRCTIRELYYKNVNVTQKQENVSEALKTICCLLDAAPWELGVLSTSKGLIAGPLEIHLPDNSIIDCSIDRNGITLPHLTAGIVDLKTTATRILVVEKDTVFKNLLQNNFLQRWNHSCILITGKGYPDTNTRLILNKLRELHSLPIDVITDADPYGIEIMLTYRHGSLSMSNLAESLAVPSVRWLGIFPSDIRKFGIRAVPLTEEDKRKLDNILNRPFINDHVHHELLIMKQINLKAEIEGISESSYTYLIDVYLRNKIDSNNSI